MLQLNTLKGVTKTSLLPKIVSSRNPKYLKGPIKISFSTSKISSSNSCSNQTKLNGISFFIWHSNKELTLLSTSSMSRGNWAVEEKITNTKYTRTSQITSSRRIDRRRKHLSTCPWCPTESKRASLTLPTFRSERSCIKPKLTSTSPSSKMSSTNNKLNVDKICSVKWKSTHKLKSNETCKPTRACPPDYLQKCKRTLSSQLTFSLTKRNEP